MCNTFLIMKWVDLELRRLHLRKDADGRRDRWFKRLRRDHYAKYVACHAFEECSSYVIVDFIFGLSREIALVFSKLYTPESRRCFKSLDHVSRSIDCQFYIHRTLQSLDISSIHRMSHTESFDRNDGMPKRKVSEKADEKWAKLVNLCNQYSHAFCHLVFFYLDGTRASGNPWEISIYTPLIYPRRLCTHTCVGRDNVTTILRRETLRSFILHILHI